MTRSIAIACALLAAAWAAAGADEPDPDVPVLQWKQRQDLRDVRDIACHPFDPQTAWMITGAGLLKSTDDGKTFQPVPSATEEKVGVVSTLAHCPADADRIVLGTERDGMFLSTDGGATWRPMSRVEEPLAGLHIACIRFCRADPSFRTVMATHGTDAPGMSITRDLGKTWEIIATGQYIRNFVKHNETIVAAASEVGSEGRVWGIHRSGTDGQRWEVCNRGIRPTDTLAARRGWRYYAATLDGEVLQSTNDGRTWFPLLKVARGEWVNLFYTHGRTANLKLMGAYGPRRHGLLLSTGGMHEGTRHKANKGLYVGAFVKSGATCRPNANGTTYYVSMNNGLWIGRRQAAAGGPVLAAVRCRPGTVWVGRAGVNLAEGRLHRHLASMADGNVSPRGVRGVARAYRTIRGELEAMGFTVEARVEHAKGPKAIKRVTVDASAFGAAPDTPLFDDGKHDDGEAGDGLYAARITFTTAVFASNRKAAWPLPGKTALTVTATDASKKTETWSAVVSIYGKPARIVLWGWGAGAMSRGPRHGPATAGRARNEGVVPGTNAVRFEATGPGPWRVAWFWGSGRNIAGRDTLSFKLRGNVNQELFVQLVDHHKIGVDVFDEPHYSHPVPLIAGGHIKAITPQWQEVRVPIRKLLPKGVYFLRMHCVGMAVSAGADGKPGGYYVDQVQMLP